MSLCCFSRLTLSLGLLGLFLSQYKTLLERALALASTCTTLAANLVGDDLVLAIHHLYELLAALFARLVHLPLLGLVSLLESVGQVRSKQWQVRALESAKLGSGH